MTDYELTETIDDTTITVASDPIRREVYCTAWSAAGGLRELTRTRTAKGTSYAEVEQLCADVLDAEVKRWRAGKGAISRPARS